MPAYTASSVEQYAADIGTTDAPNADVIKIQLLKEIRDLLAAIAKAQGATVEPKPLSEAKPVEEVMP